MQRSTEPTTTVWADGFGLLHARVTYDRNPQAAAQIAMWKWIEERQGAASPVPVVVQDESDPQVWHEVDNDTARDTPALDALMTERPVWGRDA